MNLLILIYAFNMDVRYMKCKTITIIIIDDNRDDDGDAADDEIRFGSW